MVGKSRVELENLLQFIAFDDVEVAVGQCTDISTGLSQCDLLPKNVPKHITFTCRYANSQYESVRVSVGQERSVRVCNGHYGSMRVCMGQEGSIKVSMGQ